MRDVVIVGGGLTGLSAALELEKQGIPYTLIEVKRRLGGSIQTVRQDGFVMDGAAFKFAASIWFEPLLVELGLQNQLNTQGVGADPDEPAYGFKNGTASLIQAMVAKLTAPRLMRMAVSSIGELDNGRYALCLENGIMLDAKSIILAVPARYAERMFYGYINEISQRLMDFPYDSIVRVAAGINALPDMRAFREKDSAYYDLFAQIQPVFMHMEFGSERIPPGKTLLHMGIRGKPEDIDTPLRDIVNSLALPEPVTRFVHYWAEADPIFTENHAENMAHIRALLPPGIALVGSDYDADSVRNGVANLANRIDQGRNASRQMVAFLKGSR